MGPRAKTLDELAPLVAGEVVGDGAIMVSDVTHDSRQVAERALYVAIMGASSDGHLFVDEAVSRGAAAVCVTTPVTTRAPQLLVHDTRAALGPLSDSVHGSPSRALKVIGVTGTNGKTTVTHYCESIATSAGVHVGLIGTIETRIDGVAVASARHTTPEASDFQRLLATMRERGVTLVAAEVSSHALAFGRVSATRFEVAAFTNLSQDHLDFHGDMSSYRAAKQLLFTDYEIGTAVINIDDATGAEIAAMRDADQVTVGRGGDVDFSNVVTTEGGSSFSMTTPWGAADLAAPVLGAFNVSNLMVAAACCMAAGIPFEDVTAGMREVRPVPGRFEVVQGDQPYTVVVDYAHTPDGITAAVETARQLGPGKVIGLVGAGGDRDHAKRPQMGAAISSADVVVITSDNPRSEDPGTIVDQVVSGVVTDNELIVEVDRRKAIEAALGSAGPGDIVLVLGRGHEPYQAVGNQMVPFSDREVVMDLLGISERSANSGPVSGSMFS
jgi:UDP-N-acetylmuramoyl-L-alanyl-D-glutamate--2,6-diaminopimelate ligase